MATMTYAAERETTTREQGSILLQAGARLHQAARTNDRLTAILNNLRPSGPLGLPSGRDDAPEPRRPLADVIERIEAAQDQTSKLLDEIETLVGG